MAGTELISALAGVAGTAANPLMQVYQNRWNQRMMEQQNKWNIEQWNRENAYNLPYNQVSRLRDAGINPALAFANGDLMNEAAASPAMQASQGKAPQVDPLAFAQIELMHAQSEQAKADASEAESRIPYHKQQAKYMEELTDKTNAEVKKLGFDIQFLDGTLATRIASENASNELSKAEADEQRQYVARKFKNSMDQLDEQLKILKNNKLITDEQINEAKSRAGTAEFERQIMEYNESMKEVRFWIEAVGDGVQIIGDIVNIIMEFVPAGRKNEAIRLLRRMQRKRNYSDSELDDLMDDLNTPD